MKNITLAIIALCSIVNFSGCQTVGINLDEAYWDRHDHCDKYVQEKWNLQHDNKLTNDDVRKINAYLHSLPKTY